MRYWRLYLTAWPPYARIARAETLTIRNALIIIHAIKLQGAGAIAGNNPTYLALVYFFAGDPGDTWIWRELFSLLPDLASLGLGAQPPSPEWGAMISAGQAIHSRSLVGGNHAGPGNLHGVAGIQFTWRWSARCA